MSIVVNGLTRLFGKQKAIDALSFELNKGEILGFLGPNGAGKSTTMKIITGYLKPTHGSARVCGMDVVNESIGLRHKIGYLPEQNPLYHDMYVLEYLHHIASFYHIDNRAHAVEKMISLTGLKAEQGKKIGQLSKGYKQRVGLAQAMIHDPEVLILDEPTSGLDPNQLAEIRSLIRKIGEKKTVILSTHIMQEVEAICDRVVIINKGKLVIDKHIDELRSQNRKKTIIELKLNGQIDPGLIKNLPGVDKVVHTQKEYVIESSDQSEDISQRVFDLMVSEGFKVLRLNERKESLEDLFKRLTTD